MCKYSNVSGMENCPYESAEGSDYCIFHLQNGGKNIITFNNGIKEILETKNKSINFTGFYFPLDITDFSGTIFSEYVYFRDAEFEGNVDFRNAKFKRGADFGDAKFRGYADFRNTEFGGSAIFRNAKFEGETRFWFVVFRAHTTFGDVVFSRKTYFSAAKFEYDASFTSAEFKEDTYFIDVIFEGDTNFKLAKFRDRFILTPKKNAQIGFTSVYFSDNVQVKADLSKCYFANSNIERIDMTDSIWRRDDKTKNSSSALYKWFRNKVGLADTSIIILEEHEDELSPNWKELEGIYRRLKQSYQKYGDNSTAGKLYYQEMECKRKQLRGFDKGFWYIFYKRLCGYGEIPFNVIFTSLFIIFMFSFFYLFGGIEFVGSSVLKESPNLIEYNLSLNFVDIQWAISNIDMIYEDFLVCLYTSIITFTTLGYGDIHPIGWSRLFASVEAGLGIIMTALFIFVFTRKMLR